MPLIHFNVCNLEECRQRQVCHRTMRLRSTVRAMVCVGIVFFVASIAHAASPKLDAIESAERAEAARIAVIERIAPAVVCIFDTDERGGGSGVIISPDGYGLTNYHVVEGMIESRSGFGGLADGKLYPLQVLGIDPGGDVAMFKLDGLDRFPFATLGDSDKLQVGDTAIAMGNPFLLSDDYTPTVTMGIVSGIHRYQYGSGDALLYSDCIQVDTAINPGNSGGPLFNERGEIIGINGRISVSMRGRVNVGLGYAITSNQIKPFIPGLRAGLLVDHGTIQAIVRDRDNGVIFVELLEDGPAWNIGVRPGDELLRFASQPIRSANHFASVLGTLPGGWPVAVSYRDANGALHHRETRTEAVKVKRSEGFVPDPDVAMLAVEKVLARFRKTIDADAIKKSPRTWRETLASADAPESPPLEYEVKEAADGSMTWTVTKGVTSNVSVSEQNGEWVATTDGAPLSVGMDLAHRARHFVQQRLIRETDNSTARGLEHCGADAILDIAADGTVQSTLLECISARLGEHASIRLGFDAKNGNLRRIIATDNPTKEVVRLTFTDAQGWPL
ncbi:MAG: trypsin-like serine protease, partial [Planctomycetes bacterium]|nr:trypsin-like serine protease [Planctomycetota bacterium]